MYVNPFIAGILTTILMNVLLISWIFILIGRREIIWQKLN